MREDDEDTTEVELRADEGVFFGHRVCLRPEAKELELGFGSLTLTATVSSRGDCGIEANWRIEGGNARSLLVSRPGITFRGALAQMESRIRYTWPSVVLEVVHASGSKVEHALYRIPLSAEWFSGDWESYFSPTSTGLLQVRGSSFHARPGGRIYCHVLGYRLELEADPGGGWIVMLWKQSPESGGPGGSPGYVFGDGRTPGDAILQLDVKTGGLISHLLNVAELLQERVNAV